MPKAAYEFKKNATIRSSPPGPIVSYGTLRDADLILPHVSIALMLGSMWTLALAALITIPSPSWRTALEDRTLRRELSGYEDICVMRYRLMPGIW